MKKIIRNLVTLFVVLAVIFVVVLEFDSIFSDDKTKEETYPQEKLETIEEGNLKVHYLDVGQGDAIFVELPSKETILIDAGNKSNGEGIVEYIKSKGYDTLNFVIATHPHADHIGGMEEVIRNLKIDKFYMPKKSHTTKTFENMLAALKERQVPVSTAKSGVSIFNYDNLKGNLISPVKDNYSNLNDFSAVFKLEYLDRSFLFTGDAEKGAEEAINSEYKTDVLKVGHHGSDTSTTDKFLEKASPKYPVISVGEDNKYNHPSDSTLKKLNDKNIEVYRTDLDGTVIFTTDGYELIIEKVETDI